MFLSLFSDSVTLIVQQKCHPELDHRSSIIGFIPKEGEKGCLQKFPLVFFVVSVIYLGLFFPFLRFSKKRSSPWVVGGWFIGLTHFRFLHCFQCPLLLSGSHLSGSRVELLYANRPLINRLKGDQAVSLVAHF